MICFSTTTSKVAFTMTQSLPALRVSEEMSRSQHPNAKLVKTSQRLAQVFVGVAAIPVHSFKGGYNAHATTARDVEKITGVTPLKSCHGVSQRQVEDG
jgi:hypothetical protein